VNRPPRAENFGAGVFQARLDVGVPDHFAFHTFYEVKKRDFVNNGLKCKELWQNSRNAFQPLRRRAHELGRIPNPPYRVI
jgi:hypothetical protein